jgi:hypothetical protein
VGCGASGSSAGVYEGASDSDLVYLRRSAQCRFLLGETMNEELKCVHGIEGLSAIQECNQSLSLRMDKVLDLLRGTCEY